MFTPDTLVIIPHMLSINASIIIIAAVLIVMGAFVKLWTSMIRLPTDEDLEMYRVLALRSRVEERMVGGRPIGEMRERESADEVSDRLMLDRTSEADMSWQRFC